MSERERFVCAFLEALNENPEVAPGPTALARAMGSTNTRNLNGRLAALRAELLKRSGFTKDDEKNRWTKIGRPARTRTIVVAARQAEAITWCRRAGVKPFARSTWLRSTPGSIHGLTITPQDRVVYVGPVSPGMREAVELAQYLGALAARQ